MTDHVQFDSYTRSMKVTSKEQRYSIKFREVFIYYYGGKGFIPLSEPLLSISLIYLMQRYFLIRWILTPQ